MASSRSPRVNSREPSRSEGSKRNLQGSDRQRKHPGSTITEAFITESAMNHSLGSAKTAHMNSHEVREQREWWIRRAQNTVKDDQQFHVNREQLNLQENNVGILECRGRIIEEYPVYISDIHQFATSLVREVHIMTLQGGVGLTMAKVRERYWIPRLRCLVKKIRSDCNGCKRFRAKAYQAPPLEIYQRQERKEQHLSKGLVLTMPG